MTNETFCVLKLRGNVLPEYAVPALIMVACEMRDNHQVNCGRVLQMPGLSGVMWARPIQDCTLMRKAMPCVANIVTANGRSIITFLLDTKRAQTVLAQNDWRVEQARMGMPTQFVELMTEDGWPDLRELVGYEDGAMLKDPRWDVDPHLRTM